MPQFTILPATHLIWSQQFPELALQTVQAAMTLPGMVAVILGVSAALMIRYGLASKKAMTLVGLAFIALSGVIAIFLNTQFWHLCLMNISIGAGIGIFLPSAQSIMFDSFDEKTRQLIAGVQFSFVNGGGLILSATCGLLITIVWYGGHLQMLLAIPLMILAYIVLPKDKRMKFGGESGNTRTKMPPRVFYYGFLIILFMIIYNVATVNISTHIAQGNMGDSKTAGFATAFFMGGGVAFGFVFPKLSQIMRDYIFTLNYIVMAIGFTLMNLFPTSLAITFAAVFICGASMSMLVPRCIFQASNLTDETNSATATMLVCCIAPGSGSFISPIIMTNLTLALGGESTRFRFQFTAFICLAAAIILFFYTRHKEKS